MAREIPYIDTSVTVQKTVAEIETILQVHGASQIVKNFESGRIKAIAFMHEDIPFQLPSNVDAIYQRIVEGRKDNYGRWLVRGRWSYGEPDQQARETWYDQAERCGWRNVMYWVKAQLALVEIGMVTVTEVFLPYMLMDGTQTLYQRMLTQGLKALAPGEADAN